MRHAAILSAIALLATPMLTGCAGNRGAVHSHSHVHSHGHGHDHGDCETCSCPYGYDNRPAWDYYVFGWVSRAMEHQPKKCGTVSPVLPVSATIAYTEEYEAAPSETAPAEPAPSEAAPMSTEETPMPAAEPAPMPTPDDATEAPAPEVRFDLP